MNSFQCNQMQSWKVKLLRDMGCRQISYTNCIVSLAMSQVVPLLSQALSTLTAYH